MELNQKQSECRLVMLDHDKTHDRGPTVFRRIILWAVSWLIAYHISIDDISYQLLSGLLSFLPVLGQISNSLLKVNAKEPFRAHHYSICLIPGPLEFSHILLGYTFVTIMLNLFTGRQQC
jgi:hypothetical protein